MRKNQLRILIISRSYPPDSNVAARRWGLLVAQLIKLGAQCTVITSGFAGETDRMGGNHEPVIVLPVGKGYAADISLSCHIQSAKDRVFCFLRGFKPVLLDNSTQSWMAELYARRKALLRVAENSDLIISSYGPSGPLLVGRQLGNWSGTPWVADIRDSFESRQVGINFVGRFLSRFLEKICLKNAAVRITIGQYLAGYLGSRYNMPFKAIYNGWEDTDVINDPGEDSDSAISYLYYAGTIYEHQLQAWLVLLDALKRTDGLHLKLRLLNDLSGKVYESVRTQNLEKVVEILPPTDQATVKRELARAKAAVVLEAVKINFPWSSGTVTGKLLGLLASGKPGIAIASGCGEIAGLVRKVKGWYCVDTVDDCQKALNAVVQYNESTNGSEAMVEYRMDRQAVRLLDILRLENSL